MLFEALGKLKHQIIISSVLMMYLDFCCCYVCC